MFRNVELLVLALSWATAAHGIDSVFFDIPRQRADLALTEFAQQADIPVLFPFDEVSRVTANGLVGEYEIEEGLKILLKGTGLTTTLEERGQVIVHISDSTSEREQERNESEVAEMNNGTRRNGVIATIVGALLGGTTAVAQAQEGEAQQAGARGVLEEVVVVAARRRDEELQDIPLSIAAFDAAGLELRGVTELQDLDHAVPNANFRGGDIRPEDEDAFFIRGVPGVATYVDGIAIASGQNLLSRGMVEIQRVEVLRGPQGTLFGRLSTGGALQLITVPPAEEFGVRGELTFGDYNQRDANVSVDLPVGDTLLTKWTASTRNRDGYQQSVVAEDFALGDLNDQLLRGDFFWTPTEDFDIRLAFTNTEFDRNGSAFGLISTLPDNVERANRFGLAEIAGLNMDNDFLRVGGDVVGEWETWTSYGQQRMDEDAVTLDLNWDFSDTFSLRYLHGYIDQVTDYLIDNDFTPYNLTDSWRHREAIQRSSELQLLFNTSRFNGVIGVYSLDFRPRQSVVGTRDTEYLHDPEAQAAILAVSPRIEFDRRTRDLSQSESETRAVYGEVDFDISEQLTLTLGVRWNEDKETDYQMLSTAGVSPPDTLLYIASPNPNPLDNGYSGDPFRGEILDVLSSDFNSTTGRAALRYRLNPDLMVYASYAEGFSGGGFNVEGPPLFPPDTIIPFDPETVDSFEVGVRSDWMGGQLRFNATVFSMTWDDIHLPVPRINPITLEAERGSWTVNAGEGQLDGMEFELIYRPTDLWRLHFNGAWLDSEYSNIAPGVTSITAGSAFENAPDFSYDIGGFRDILLSNGTLTARLQYSWMDDQRLHQDEFRANVQEAFGILNAGLTYRPQQGTWSIFVSGTNLTDEWYTTSGFNSGVLGSDARALGQPRMVSFGVRVSL